MRKFSQVSQRGIESCAREGVAEARWPIPGRGDWASANMECALNPRLETPQSLLLRADEVIQ